MILAYIENIESSKCLVQSVLLLSVQLDKKMAVVSSQGVSAQETELLQLATDKPDVIIYSEQLALGALNDFCESREVALLLVQCSQTKRKYIQQKLTACRQLRIPYLFFKNEFEILNLEKVLVPVSFLEEELEKAQFAAAFGRFFESEIYIFQANDYGSKAARTVEKMVDLFSKFDFKYQVVPARNDSFKVDKEMPERASELQAGLIIVSASREYGLDDLVFGPQELHLVRKSKTPLLLVNPRADLYALCD